MTPGTVRAVLEGPDPDLVRLTLFFEAVTQGEHPADALRRLRLAAIAITDETGRNHRVTLTFRLTEAA